MVCNLQCSVGSLDTVITTSDQHCHSIQFYNFQSKPLPDSISGGQTFETSGDMPRPGPVLGVTHYIIIFYICGN